MYSNLREKFSDVPAPPKGPLEVSDVTKDSCVLTWEPPEDDGGAEIRYVSLVNKFCKRFMKESIKSTHDEYFVAITWWRRETRGRILGCL